MKNNKETKKKLSSTDKILTKTNTLPNISPIDTVGMFKKAFQYHQSGQLHKAEGLYLKILEINPNHSDSLHLSGIIAQQSGNYDIAVNLIKKAIQSNPGNPMYYYNLGIVYENQGKMDEATSYYQKALKLKPDYAEAYNNLGNLLKGQGRIVESVSYFQKALKFKPDYAEACTNLDNIDKHFNMELGRFVNKYINHMSRLVVLKNTKTIEVPKLIYDIGANAGNWSTEIKQIFPNADFHLFEANEDCLPDLQRSGFNHTIILLGSSSREVSYYKTNMSVTTGNSIYIEQSNFTQTFKPTKKQMTTLDDWMAANNHDTVDMVKLDVQGAELEVFKGASIALKTAKIIACEVQTREYNLGAPFSHEVIHFLSKNGFRMIDILEMHYTASDLLFQVDLLFVKV